jgi:hypothetical protein
MYFEVLIVVSSTYKEPETNVAHSVQDQGRWKIEQAEFRARNGSCFCCLQLHRKDEGEKRAKSLVTKLAEIEIKIENGLYANSNECSTHKPQSIASICI